MQPPGWYPDPTGRFEHRYHNGARWTADVAANGQRYVDPVAGQRPPMPTRAGQPSRPNGLATAGMVCGVVGLAISWIPFLAFVGLVTAIIGVVFGAVGLRRSRPSGDRRASAITGVVTGTAGILVSVFGIWLTFAITRALDEYESPEPSDAELSSCSAVGDDVVAKGSIRNLGDDEQTYTVHVRLERGTRRSRVRRAVVDDVAPAAEATFSVEADLGDVTTETTCEIEVVRGPPPFGLDVDLD